MFFLYLFTVTTVLWQEDFTENMSTMSQLYDYTVDISHQDGKVFLKANPQFEGFSSAWFYVDEDLAFCDDDILELIVRVHDKKARLKYFYRKEGCSVYYGGVKVVAPDTQWQKVEIPLKDARPFYSSNYPSALTPDKTPCLYIFITNELPGNFDVEIDWMSVVRPESHEEER